MNRHSIDRPLANAVIAAPRKVAIIEGARGVGKTWMVEHQIVPCGYRYVDLGNDSVLDEARRSPEEWFESLGANVIFDEAQRLDRLPLLVKGAVDRVAASSPLYILTGSASIGRASLSGQDPLARRSMRFRLDPLTQRELAGDSHNIVDDLFDAVPLATRHTPISRDAIMSLMAIGGFPDFVLDDAFQRADERSRAIASDIESILGTALLPDRRGRSALAAQPLLQRLLSEPGGIVNYVTLGSQLSLDGRTIKAYLGELQRRFLVYGLTNLFRQPQRQSSAHPKVHPVDTALAVDALRTGGTNILDRPEIFGLVFESYVANQILPAISWSSRAATAFYWRGPSGGSQEVDLVLESEGDIVGIEVKSGTRVGPGDFSQLERLSNERGLSRGFVIYGGNESWQFRENLWALPLSALWEPDAFDRPEPIDSHPSPIESGLRTIVTDLPGGVSRENPVDANLLVSYDPRDEAYLHGAIMRFIDAVGERYSFETGGRLNICPIGNGDADWRLALHRARNAINIVMPQVTPRYLQSPRTREEFFALYGYCEHARDTIPLALAWQGVDDLVLGTKAAEARDLFERSPYRDVSDLVDLSPDESAYRRLAREVCASLREEIAAARAAHVDPGDSSSDPGASDTDRESLERDFTTLRGAIRMVRFDMADIGARMRLGPTDGTDSPLQLERLVSRLSGRAESLESDLDNLEGSWMRFSGAAIERIATTSQGDRVRQTHESLRDLLDNLHALRRDLTTSECARTDAHAMSRLSNLDPRLRELGSSMNSYLELSDHLATTVDGFIDALRR